MDWQETRQQYPNTWLVIEALIAHTDEQIRRLDDIAVVEACEDGGRAMARYRELHHQHPDREFYFVHTSRRELDIRVRQWLGIRMSHADRVA